MRPLQDLRPVNELGPGIFGDRLHRYRYRLLRAAKGCLQRFDQCRYQAMLCLDVDRHREVLDVHVRHDVLLQRVLDTVGMGAWQEFPTQVTLDRPHQPINTRLPQQAVMVLGKIHNHRWLGNCCQIGLHE